MTIATKRKDSLEGLAGDKYFRLIEHAADGITIIQDGVFKLVNTALTRISGYDKEELLGMPFTQLLTPQSQKLTMARYQARLAGKKVPPVYEIQAVTKDGKIRDIELNAALTEYEGRVADEVIIRDITERKQAEEKLQAILKTALDGFWLTNLEGKILEVNDSYCKMVGHTREELLTMSTSDVEALESPTEVAQHRKRVIEQGYDSFESQHKRKDGRIIDVEVSVNYLDVGEGQLFVFARDITERKKTEQALADEATRRRILVEQSRDGIVVLDQNGKVYEANQQFAEMLGYTPEEAAELHMWDWDTQWSREQLLEMVRSIDAAGDHFETYHRRKDGTTIDVEISTNGAMFAGRKLIFCVCRDITERKKAEQALADEATRRRILIDQSRDGIVILDENGKVYEANQQFAEMLGYTPEEAAELHTWDWDTQWSREELLEMIRSVDAAGDHFETYHRRKDGTTIDVEISTNGAICAGQKLIFCVCRDITERKQAEEKLQQSNKRFRDIVANALEWIWEVDASGKYTYASPIVEKILGYKPEEVLEKHFYDLLHPDDRQELKKAALAVFAQKQPFRQFVNRNLHKNGEIVWLSTSGVPILDEGGNLLGYRGADVDITERKQAEEALKESDKRFRDIAENALEWIWEADVSGKYTYASPIVEQILGYKPEEVVEKHFYDLFHPDDRQELKKAAFKAFAQKQPFRQFVNRNLHKNGEIVWLSTSGVPILDEEGNLLGYRGADVDITERKQAEEKLQESEAKFRNLFEHTKDAILLADTQIGVLIDANPAACNMLRLPKERIVGMYQSDIHPPEMAERYKELFLNHIEKGIAVTEDLIVQRSDGSQISVDISASVTELAGRPVIQGVFRDITERKQMEGQLREEHEQLDAQNEELRTINEELQATEEELQHSQEKLERMFESVTDGISVINLNGVITKVNQRTVEIHGFASEDEMLGRNAFDLVAPRDHERIAADMRQALKERLIIGGEYTMLRADGSEFPGELSTSALKDGRGKAMGHISTVRDITERKQAEEREKQLEQELNLAGRLASIGQLAAGVAHEINNPLTGVIGFSHLMMNRNIPNDMKQDLQVINSEAQRVAKIVENLLVFAHQRKTGREYVFINDIITKVLELRAYEMKVNNIEVETQLDPNLPLTLADTGQLQQVFLNIVLNAEYSMKKAHHKGNLLVKTKQINGNIRASLTDNGAGISRENLDKIFNPFFTTKEVGKGTGLGLSICHGIITQHKGRIYAQSESGKGATFVIELPIVAEPAQADKAKKTQKEPQKPRGAKILVVDDEEAILTFLRRLLTEWGHSVETINNADAALERLKTERYSLILLDIKLPGMSGIELYHHIEEIAPALTRRVMFITGDIMETSTRSFLEKARVPHITKPIDIEVLKKMMNNALNQTQVAPKASG